MLRPRRPLLELGRERRRVELGIVQWHVLVIVVALLLHVRIEAVAVPQELQAVAAVREGVPQRGGVLRPTRKVPLEDRGQVDLGDVPRLEARRRSPAREQRRDPEGVRRQHGRRPQALLELLQELLEGVRAQDAGGQGHRPEHAPGRQLATLQVLQGLREHRQDLLQQVLRGDARHLGSVRVVCRGNGSEPDGREVRQLLQHIVLLHGGVVHRLEQVVPLRPQGANLPAREAARPERVIRPPKVVDDAGRVVHRTKRVQDQALHLVA
mmetsp:Transcript_46504/g.141142  ORF Transcript_46504/g.141142 Transcript_46504/m.141142 type:complete len:267 (+) Transcript_46504:3981-4781(+)